MTETFQKLVKLSKNRAKLGLKHPVEAIQDVGV
jgi:hypothetical protein